MAARKCVGFDLFFAKISKLTARSQNIPRGLFFLPVYPQHALTTHFTQLYTTHNTYHNQEHMKAATMANSMMAFTEAMDALATKVAGENGCPELDTTTDPRVDLFFAAVRDVPAARLAELVSACLADSRISKEDMTLDLIALLFQTRNCRGGKGERQVSTTLAPLLTTTHHHTPHTTRHL